MAFEKRETREAGLRGDLARFRRQESSADGEYVYRWMTRFGQHIAYFQVTGGVIKASQPGNSPVVGQKT